jgi:hypothetical protein
MNSATDEPLGWRLNLALLLGTGEDNELLLQTQKVASLPSQLQLNMAGSGCALVQTVLRY